MVRKTKKGEPLSPSASSSIAVYIISSSSSSSSSFPSSSLPSYSSPSPLPPPFLLLLLLPRPLSSILLSLLLSFPNTPRPSPVFTRPSPCFSSSPVSFSSSVPFSSFVVGGKAPKQGAWRGAGLSARERNQLKRKLRREFSKASTEGTSAKKFKAAVERAVPEVDPEAAAMADADFWQDVDNGCWPFQVCLFTSTRRPFALCHLGHSPPTHEFIALASVKRLYWGGRAF